MFLATKGTFLLSKLSALLTYDSWFQIDEHGSRHMLSVSGFSEERVE